MLTSDYRSCSQFCIIDTVLHAEWLLDLLDEYNPCVIIHCYHKYIGIWGEWQYLISSPWDVVAFWFQSLPDYFQKLLSKAWIGQTTISNTNALLAICNKKLEIPIIEGLLAHQCTRDFTDSVLLSPFDRAALYCLIDAASTIVANWILPMDGWPLPAFLTELG